MATAPMASGKLAVSAKMTQVAVGELDEMIRATGRFDHVGSCTQLVVQAWSHTLDETRGKAFSEFVAAQYAKRLSGAVAKDLEVQRATHAESASQPMRIFAVCETVVDALFGPLTPCFLSHTIAQHMLSTHNIPKDVNHALRTNFTNNEVVLLLVNRPGSKCSSAFIIPTTGTGTTPATATTVAATATATTAAAAGTTAAAAGIPTGAVVMATGGIVPTWAVVPSGAIVPGGAVVMTTGGVPVLVLADDAKLDDPKLVCPCGRIAPRILRCESCDLPRYCSTACQKQLWAQHRPFCQPKPLNPQLTPKGKTKPATPPPSPNTQSDTAPSIAPPCSIAAMLPGAIGPESDDASITPILPGAIVPDSDNAGAGRASRKGSGGVSHRAAEADADRVQSLITTLEESRFWKINAPQFPQFSQFPAGPPDPI
jgi:hypothetical protein